MRIESGTYRVVEVKCQRTVRTPAFEAGVTGWHDKYGIRCCRCGATVPMQGDDQHQIIDRKRTRNHNQEATRVRSHKAR